MNFQVSEVIESYQSHFKSSIGAYVYMHLNQVKPEFFVLDSSEKNPIAELMENICKNANSLDNILAEVKTIPQIIFNQIQEKNNENDLSKKGVLKSIGNIKHLDIDWQDNNKSWANLTGHIEFNNYSLFLNSADKKKIQMELKTLTDTFGLKKICINPNYNPNEFIDNFKSGVNNLCATLNITPKQIGLGFLEVNYKTEDGDFTGYMETIGKSTFRNKMVINKLEVFTHEWMHFVESALGFNGYNLTEIITKLSKKDYTSLFPDLKNIQNFPSLLVKEEKKLEDLKFKEAISSASHFFERYAIDKDNFYYELGKITDDIQLKIKSNSSTTKIFESLEKSIKKLLSPTHPTRYFSFLKAQCELEIERQKKNDLSQNQFIDFANKADKHLGESNYTASLAETFARSFESFVFDKTSKCSVLAKTYDSDFYPQGKMRANLQEFWDISWKQIKSQIDIVVPPNSTIKNKSWSINNISTFRDKFNKKSSSIKNNI